jgi:hypothetical protein
MSINIVQELIDAGTKYKKELLAMPVATLAKFMKHAVLKTGIQGREVGGILTTDAELRPYRTAKDATDTTEITPYEWETFLGDVVKEFDPNAILGTLYTERTAVKPDKRAFAKRVALEMAKKVGEKLYDNLFIAVRNAAGNNTVDLFNGYATQIAAAIASGALAEGKGNYMDLTATPFTVDNVGDRLKYAWRNLDRILKGEKVELMLPDSILDMYEDWYAVEYGHTPWKETQSFEQRTLVGSRGRCTFVPLDNMEGTDYLKFTVKENVKVGCDQESDKENVEIRRPDNPKMVQFFMMAYFGVGYETMAKEYFTAVKYTTDVV